MKKISLKSSLDWTVILKSLADESRLQIIRQLLKGEVSVNKLSDTLGLKVYNVSRHLRILETSGLVEKRKESNRRIYRITEEFQSRFSQNNQVLDLGCCLFKFRNLKK
jgi:DNA-binding transcriptional ArsR family regulator